MDGHEALSLISRLEPPHTSLSHPGVFVPMKRGRLCQKIFNIPMAKIKTVVEPNSVVNDVWWESIAFVGTHWPILPISVT
jgi:hypothetical protein